MNAGIKYPVRPEIINAGIFFDSNFFKFFIAQGAKAIPAIKILPAPSSTAVNVWTIFLTNMKERPQMTAKKN